MDYIILGLYLLVFFCLLIGTTKKEKLWFGSIYGTLAVIFFIGAQLIKYQTGYLTSPMTAEEESDILIILGNWVLPFFIVLGLSLLVLINYRLIKKAITEEALRRWGLVGLAVLISVAYVGFGSFIVFIVAFTYFPFAP